MTRTGKWPATTPTCHESPGRVPEPALGSLLPATTVLPPMPWQELKRLEKCCDVTLRSHLDQRKRLFWRMTIQPREPAGPRLITTEAPEIQEAVRMGVEKAIDAKLISRVAGAEGIPPGNDAGGAAVTHRPKRS